MKKQKKQINLKISKNNKIAQAKKHQEIERKFLIKNLPEKFLKYPHQKILQGYLAIIDDGSEIRLRQHGNEYFQTIKKGDGKIRTEIEIKISKKQFDSLWSGTLESKIEKIRYKIPYQKFTIEVDVYQGRLNGLILAEVEFDDEDESNDFIIPDWFGEEQTENSLYKNKNLSQGYIFIPQEKKKEVDEKLSIPEYSLESGLKELTNLINEKLKHTKDNLIVQIAGGSASGKTSAVSKIIKDNFPDQAIIFSCDDYYKGNQFIQSEYKQGHILNWDQPEAVNLDLFGKHLLKLKNNESVDKPIYDMKACESLTTEKVFPKKIIIAEGLFVLDKSLESYGDLKVFVEIGAHGRIIRRLLRDITRTGQKPLDIFKYFLQVVQPMHEKYIDATKKKADLIINNEYNPNIESEKSGMSEKQVKFKTSLDINYLREIGAEILSSTIQTDTYFNPQDRDLKMTGEILRIRNEGGKKIITYKGPKKKDEVRERPKFEFYIDDQTEKVISQIYPNIVKKIKKERILFKLDNIIFSIDNQVTKIENNKKVELGNFVEVRFDNASQIDLKKFIKKLNLKESQITKEAYFEM